MEPAEAVQSAVEEFELQVCDLSLRGVSLRTENGGIS